MNLRERLKTGDLIILDGALGTELSRRRIDTKLPLWSAGALINHPREVERIHTDYVRSGAEIVTTNTFRTNLRTVEKAAISQTVGQLTRTAVALAKRAAKKSKKKVFVAGSMAPVEDCYRPDLVPSDKELRREHRVLADDLKRSGVDLILVETMNTIREAVIAARAAKRTGLPVLVSFTLRRDGRLLSGESLVRAAKAVEDVGVDAVLINCFPVSWSLQPFQTLRRATKLPVGIYANGEGAPQDGQGWHFVGGKRLEAYLKYAQKWIKMGAKIIGGCCGTTPEYISRITELAIKNNLKSKGV